MIPRLIGSAKVTDRQKRATIQKLESYARAGVTQVRAASSKAKQSKPASKSLKEQPVIPSMETPALFESDQPTSPPRCDAPSLEALAQIVAGCTLCKELAGTRTQTVFGVGNPKARLCFFGEAPGADEDRQGEPFVGRAGQLLNKIIEACQMRREDVYIFNVLKCRPPKNRNPAPDECDNCRKYYQRQIELIGPEFICCLGAVAAQELLSTTLSIGKLRGKIHDYHGMKVVCTYHPAYLLRNPSAKKDTWDDMKMLMHEMGVEV
jgi:DNA polymerase